MVQARLSSLPTHARRVLRAAAVFGGRFWVAGVSKLLGVDVEDPELWSSLELLRRQELVLPSRRSQLPGQRELYFAYELMREGSYAMLTDEDRRLGHRLAAEWLETTGQGDPVVLAKHFASGDEPHRARPWFRRAAQHALEGNDLSAAIEQATQAKQAGPNDDDMGELELILAEAQCWLGKYPLASKHATIAMDELEVGSASWFRAATVSATGSFHCSAHDDVVAILDRLRHTPPQSEAQAAKVAALCQVGWFAHYGGAVERAATAIESAAETVRLQGVRSPGALAWVNAVRAVGSYYRGDLAAYLKQCQRSVQLFDIASDARRASSQRLNVAIGYLQCGQYERAEQVLQELLGTAQRLGLPKLQATVYQNLGVANMELGRLPQARLAMEQTRRLADELDSDRLRGLSLYLLGELLSRSDNHEGAEPSFTEAERLLGTTPSLHFDVLVALANQRWRQGRFADALELVAQATGLANAMEGLGSSEYQLQLVHAEVLCSLARHDDARAVLEKVVPELQHAAAALSDPQLRDSYLQAVPTHRRIIQLARTLGVDTT